MLYHSQLLFSVFRMTATTPCLMSNVPDVGVGNNRFSITTLEMVGKEPEANSGIQHGRKVCHSYKRAVGTENTFRN